MGMGYQFNGSASYPRFNEELTKIVTLFGGTVTKTLEEEQSKVTEGSVDWWFGRPMSELNEKFIFKDEVPESFKKWANDPYGNFTFEETEEIFNLLQTKKLEVCEISNQMYHEFELLMEFNCEWSIV